jgi:RNA polymerase sigma factor (sigma-70 family)
VLQEVFVNAYRAMLADEREINLRPWLYRIARNRCLNHLRKPSADAQESMDMVPEVEAASTAEKVHNREEFRQIISDVNKLPETQRSALLLREMDALSYEEIADAMETTVPSVKSLLVRARISLGEASQARLLTCGEVRVELSEAAEGLRKVSAPVRRHVRECEECADFRSQVRSNEKALAALFPVGPLIAFKGFIISKLGLGGTGGASAGAAGAGTAGAGAGALGSVGAALGGGSAAGGLGALGGAIGTKAVAGVVTAAVLTAGAVEVKQTTSTPAAETATPAHVKEYERPAEPALASAEAAPINAPHTKAPAEVVEAAPIPAPTESVPAAEEEAPPATTPTAAEEEAAGQSSAEEDAAVDSEAIGVATPSEEVAGAHGGGETVVVTVGGETPPPSEPPASSPPPPPPPPPAEAPAPEAGSVPPVELDELPTTPDL